MSLVFCNQVEVSCFDTLMKAGVLLCGEVLYINVLLSAMLTLIIKMSIADFAIVKSVFLLENNRYPGENT